VPAVSLTVNTELASATEQAGLPELGAVTAQAESEAKAMPAPDSVMTIPALVPAVMAVLGVNETVAVVDAALAEEVSVIARPDNCEIPGNVPVMVLSMMVGVPAEKSLEVPAAMLVKATCPAVGVVNFVRVKVMAANAAKVPPVSLTVNTELASAAVQVGLPELGAVKAQA